MKYCVNPIEHPRVKWDIIGLQIRWGYKDNIGTISHISP